MSETISKFNAMNKPAQNAPVPAEDLSTEKSRKCMNCGQVSVLVASVAGRDGVTRLVFKCGACAYFSWVEAVS